MRKVCSGPSKHSGKVCPEPSRPSGKVCSGPSRPNGKVCSGPSRPSGKVCSGPSRPSEVCSGPNSPSQCRGGQIRENSSSFVPASERDRLVQNEPLSHCSPDQTRVTWFCRTGLGLVVLRSGPGFQGSLPEMKIPWFSNIQHESIILLSSVMDSLLL